MLKAMDTLPKDCWPRILGSVVIPLYAGDKCWSGLMT